LAPTIEEMISNCLDGFRYKMEKNLANGQCRPQKKVVIAHANILLYGHH
jgi:hypothetical protein